MLVKTMETAGINGTFRHTCELVLKVLRMYKDSRNSFKIYLADFYLSLSLDLLETVTG